MLWWPLMMDGVSDDSWVERRRRDYVVDQIETVPMTAEQYERAVSALATLIVEWATSRRRDNSVTPVWHPVILTLIDQPPPQRRFGRRTVRIGRSRQASVSASR